MAKTEGCPPAAGTATGGNTLPVEILTGPDPVAAVIWLHGLGADGHDFEPIIPELSLPPEPRLRFVFPHAPFRAVTINGGYVMRAWYDLGLADGGLWQNQDHLREAQGAVTALIEREVARGIPASRIVLAGFSQGANVALHAGLTGPHRVAGVLALSAPVLNPDTLIAGLDPAALATPVFMGHGTHDEIVPVAVARQGYENLARAGGQVVFHEYVMGHSLCGDEIADIRKWFADVVLTRCKPPILS